MFYIDYPYAYILNPLVDFKTLPVDCQNFVGPTALRVVWFNVGANLSVFVVSNCSMDALEDEMEKVHGVD